MNRKAFVVPSPDASIRELGRNAFSRRRSTWRAQLRSATLLDQIRHSDARVPEFTFEEVDVARANDLVRLAELTRPLRDRRKDPGELPAIAQTYADLAASPNIGQARRAELLAMAASTWSLAGYQANASAMGHQYLGVIDEQAGHAPLQVEPTNSAAPAALAVLVGAVLQRDVAEVARLGAMAEIAVRSIGRRLIEEQGDEPIDPADAAVLGAYGLAARSARALARFWRMGDVTAGQRATDDLRKAAAILMHTNVVDSWVLVDNLSHVVEDIVATSPWRMLRRTPTWNGLWKRYVRSLAIGRQPVVQVWPSQQKVLDAGLLDAASRNLAVTMPTSAGKTRLAEWAVLHALARNIGPSQARPLAVYVVPSRALAGEVERNLTQSLGAVGLRVSGLFGGSEHVQYELHLIETTDVLVVTSEKLDLLLRNDDSIGPRISLVVADEGHLLGERDRGLRLELVLTRVRRQAPQARVLMLSAVLPNGDDVATWLDPKLDGRNLVDVDWSPSGLRVGIFTWQGQEVDGQQGVVRYRDADADHDFFLPFVITRRLRRTRLFPSDAKDVAAQLALHYGRLGPVLIAAPRKAMTATAARSVLAACRREDVKWGADLVGNIPSQVVSRRERVAAAVASVAGADHELIEMVRAGIGYHHAGIHETIRLELEAAFREGALHVLCATSTLGQGVNLPAKTVIFSGTWRGQNDQLPVRDFWNIAGRAARPFLETEGHVILIAKNGTELRRLRDRYLDLTKLEPIRSTLVRLYLGLVQARLGRFPGSSTDVPETLDLGTDVEGETERWAETLDLQLLSLLAEEVVDTDDEAVLLDAVRDVLEETFGGSQLGVRDYPVAPLVRFATRRVRQLVMRVPDSGLRKAFLKTGLSLAGCESALTAARSIVAEIQSDSDLMNADRWMDLRRIILQNAIGVAEIRISCEDEHASPGAMADLASDWIDGMTVDDLRQRHGALVGVEDPMKFAACLDRIVVHDLAWVVSAIIQLVERELGETVDGRLEALPAMVKYGVSTETACFASSIGVRERPDAVSLGIAFPDDLGVSLPSFLGWVNGLTPGEVTAHVSETTARRFLQRAAALITPQEALDLLVTEEGTILSPLRGIGPMGTAAIVDQLEAGDDLVLQREYVNAADENAIAVWTPGREKIGYVAREIARVLAPLIDLEEGPEVVARLAVQSARGVSMADGGEHEAGEGIRETVRMEITVSST